MRLDSPYHALYALHDIGEIEVDRRGLDTELFRLSRLGDKLRRPDQGLGWHAAGVEAIAAHAVLLDERHLRLDRRGDVGRHQARRTRADDHQVAVESDRPGPARIDAPHFHRVQDPLRDQREKSEQHKGGEQTGREPEFSQLAARIDVGDGAGEHADLADPEISPGPDRSEPHQQIYGDKRNRRHQPQREQIERALLRDALVDRFQLLAELRLHPVAQQEARGDERERRADGGGERNDRHAPCETEDRTGKQGHHRRARQRQAGDRDIEREEREAGLQRLRLVEVLKPGEQRLQVLGFEELVAAEREVHRGCRDDQQEQRKAGFRHDLSVARTDGIITAGSWRGGTARR